MCGIAGRVTLAPDSDASLIEAMTTSMAHRGPDDRGLLVRAHAVLGHRRLSIVDLSGGRQPLANEDGSVWISYNGEVYNHAAIRADLEAKGHIFRTRSDTEAIVHAYEEDGPACVKRLRGMFAFAIWDAPRKRLLLARDRMGIKPVYYSRIGNDLLFSSDLRALLLSPDVDRTVDDEALSSYLALRYVPAPRTLLRGVKKLPPASVLIWENGRITIERYWDVLDTPLADDHPPTEAEAAAQVRERVDEAVRLRLMSEVPVGSFLSGGVDSTATTAAMLAVRDPQSPPLQSFSVGYDDDSGESELPWAALAAHELGTRHHEVRVSETDAVETLARIAFELDEPVADPASVPLWFLSRRAREGVTVVLSGEGADELFGGYAAYRHHANMERLRGFGLGAIGSLVGSFAPSGRIRRAAHLLGKPLPLRYRGVSRAFDAAGLQSLVGDAAGVERTVQAALEPIWEKTRHLSPLRRMLYLDLGVWLPDDLLVKADKMTMAHSIELRVPLLDHKLVEYAWSLPDHLKVRGEEGKRVLRRAVRGRVPQAILDRPKKGFATPSSGWLRGPLNGLMRDAFARSGSLSRQRFSRPYLDSLVAAHTAGRADHGSELWSLLVLELWLKGVSQVETFRASERVPIDDHRDAAAG